jgi:hypothetical protein
MHYGVLRTASLVRMLDACSPGIVIASRAQGQVNAPIIGFRP